MAGKPRLKIDLPRKDIMIVNDYNTKFDILDVHDHGKFWFIGNVNGHWEFWEYLGPKSFFLNNRYSVFVTPELYNALALNFIKFKLVLSWDDDGKVNSPYIRDSMIVTINIARKYITPELTAYLIKNG